MSDSGQALLTDFGISTLIEETTGTELTASTFAGSVRWMAFELFGGYSEVKGDELPNPVQLSTYSDIWSFGSTILEVRRSALGYSTTPKTDLLRRFSVASSHTTTGRRTYKSCTRSCAVTNPLVQRILAFLQTYGPSSSHAGGTILKVDLP